MSLARDGDQPDALSALGPRIGLFIARNPNFLVWRFRSLFRDVRPASLIFW